MSVEKTKHHLRIRSLKQKGHTIPQGLISSYNNIKAQTKNACRNAIDHWWKVKAAEAERVTELSIKQGRGGSIMKLLKLAKTSNIRSSANLKSKDGKLLICSSEEKSNRWKENFEDFAKTDTIVEAKLYDELIPGKIKLDDEDVQKLSKPLSKIELHKALDQCKLETVSGIDQISSNMLKIGDEVTFNWLKVIAGQIWESEVIPKNYKCQIVIPIHKNGPKSLCQNYRGISLLCVASKVFGRAVLNRLQDMVESQLGENQCGFRPNRGCCDQIFSAKILMQRAKEFNKAIYFCFVDLQRA